VSHDRRRIAVPIVLLVVAALAFYLYRQPVAAGQLTASGTVEADEVTVAAESPGRVVELLVEEGQRVGAGQTVARIDDALIQVQLRQADVAQRQVLEAQLDRLTLRAPIGGQVQKKLVNRGEVVAAGAPLITVANQDQLRLTVYVPERELGRVRVGQVVLVRADPFPGRDFPGEVQSIATRAEFTPRNVQTPRDRQALVFAVKVRVPNPGGDLKAGLPVDATFQD
jgi:HlyD family secretion protein